MARAGRRIGVLICNQYTLFREGIKALLEKETSIEIVGETSTAAEAIEQLERLKPDVVLMDVGTPDLTGFEATQRMKAIDPHVKVLILSVHEDEALISRCLEAGDSFLSTNDASRRLGDSQFLLPRGRFEQNSFFGGLKYRLGPRTKLFFRYDNAFTTMALTGPQANRFDLMTNAGTMTVDHTVNRHHSVTGSYAYLHVRPLDRDLAGVSAYQPVHSLNGGYMYTVNPGLLFRVAGGAIRGREFSYTAGGAVEKQLGGLWVMAGYQRYLSFFGGFAPSGGGVGGTVPFANGLLPNSVFQAVSVRVRGKLTKRVGVDFNGQRGRTSLGDRSFRGLIAQSRLDYKLSDRFIVFARVEYYGQNINQFSGTPLSRRRYFGGLEIVLSRPPESEETAGRRGKIPAESAEPVQPPAEEPRAPEER